MLELPLFFCISKKKKKNGDIQNFYREILNFRLFFAKKKIAIFRSGMFLWRRYALADCTHFGMYE